MQPRVAENVADLRGNRYPFCEVHFNKRSAGRRERAFMLNAAPDRFRLQGATLDYSVQHTLSTDDRRSRKSIMFADSEVLTLFGSDGYLKTEMMRLDPGGLAIGRVESSGHAIQVRDTDSLALLVPRLGHLEVAIAGKTHAVFTGSGSIIRPIGRLTRAAAGSTGHFLAATLQIPANRMALLAELGGQPLDRVFSSDITQLTNPLFLSALPRIGDDLARRSVVPVPSAVLAAITQMIDENICQWIEDRGAAVSQKPILAAFHRVREAEDIMRAYSDEPLSMLRLAQCLGVGLRSLQMAFSTVYCGLSPRDVLNAIRLEKARQRLMRPHSAITVTEVALASGFNHLGRFAIAYLKRFGEHPSQTLKRRNGARRM
jgi:AraC-like DNA-binding protein